MFGITSCFPRVFVSWNYEGYACIRGVWPGENVGRDCAVRVAITCAIEAPKQVGPQSLPRRTRTLCDKQGSVMRLELACPRTLTHTLPVILTHSI